MEGANSDRNEVRQLGRPSRRTSCGRSSRPPSLRPTRAHRLNFRSCGISCNGNRLTGIEELPKSCSDDRRQPPSASMAPARLHLGFRRSQRRTWPQIREPRAGHRRAGNRACSRPASEFEAVGHESARALKLLAPLEQGPGPQRPLQGRDQRRHSSPCGPRLRNSARTRHRHRPDPPRRPRRDTAPAR